MGGHVIVLVGNKADLESSRQVPRETAQNLADELNIKYESRDMARPVLPPNCNGEQKKKKKKYKMFLRT